MKLGGYLTFLASAVGIGALAANQDPTFESPIFSPLITPDAQVSPAGWVSTSPLQVPQKRVSVSFDNATTSDVINWLTKQGVSFMTSNAELPSSERITLNIVDQPLEDVVNAVASALGGHWESRGKILVFHRGVVAWDSARMPEGFKGLLDGKEFKALPKGSTGLMSQKDWEQFNKQLKDRMGKGGNFYMTPDKSELRTFGQGFDAKDFQKLTEEQRKEMEKAMKDAQRSMEEARKSGAFERSKLTEKQMDEIRKSIDAAHKSGAFERSKMSQKEMEELHKTLEKQFKSDEWRKGMIDAKQAEKMSKELREKLMRDNKGMFEKAKDVEGFRMAPMDFGSQDLQTLVRSLTPDQLEKHRRQGYLNYSDLTPLQRKHLGRMSRDGDWTIQYRGDGRDVTIKSDKR